MLQGAGLEVEAIAFDRKYHKGRMPTCPVTLVGQIERGRYLTRVAKMLAATPRIRRAIRACDAIYASGADIAFICWLSGLGLSKSIVLEVGDIREVQTARGVRGIVARGLDRIVAWSSSCVIATAPGFIDDYYRNWLNKTPRSLIIENKLEARPGREHQTPTVEGTPLVDRPLRIGYFGLLRCPRSWQVLEELAATRPNEIEVVIAGIPSNPEDLPERAHRHANIVYQGKYKSPDDLSSLYGSVDLVWACYPFPGPNDHNWKWAKTNRFYESCYYQRPMICLEGSGDAAEIERYDIGMLIKNDHVERVVESIADISLTDLATWQENLRNMPPEAYVYTTESDQLKSMILGLDRP